jgi:hypothetical protein
VPEEGYYVDPSEHDPDPLEEYQDAHNDSFKLCPKCRQELLIGETPSTAVEYHEQTYYAGGSDFLYCPKGCV